MLTLVVYVSHLKRERQQRLTCQHARVLLIAVTRVESCGHVSVHISVVTKVRSACWLASARRGSACLPARCSWSSGRTILQLPLLLLPPRTWPCLATQTAVPGTRRQCSYDTGAAGIAVEWLNLIACPPTASPRKR